MPEFKTKLCCLALAAALAAPGVLAQEAADAAEAAQAAAVPAAAPTRAQQDEAFLTYSRDRKAKRLSAEEKGELLALMRSYPLVDYAIAWNLQDAVEADPGDGIAFEEAIAFIESRRGEYIAERLGTDLARVAARTGKTDLFSRLWEPLQWNKTEPDIAAWREAFELEAGRGDAGKAFALLASARSLRNAWSAKLAEAAAARDPAKAWPLALLMIQGKNAAEARRLADNFTDADPTSVSSVFANPSSWLAGLGAEDAPAPDRNLVLAAVLLAANASAEPAEEAALALPETVSAEDRALIWNFLGYRRAQSSDFEGAWRCFSRAEAAPMPEALFQPAAVSEARVRAALAAGDWQAAAAAVRAMPEAQRAEEPWSYWLGRALIESGSESEGRGILKPLASRHSYYGKLACDALSLDYPGEAPLASAPTENETKEWARNAGVIRAVMLRRLRFYSMASREWNWSLRGADEARLAAAAEYARQAGLPERMINTAGRLTGSFVSAYSFPTPHLETVKKAAADTGMPAAWIYGVTRQESRFMPTVASGAGAQGLMQLMPATARWTAKRYGIGEGAPDTSDPDTNLALGAYYLKYLSERFGGQMLLATAGYNAGPGRSVVWRAKLTSPREGAVFAELIPFRETRDYVKNVLANTAEYHRILGTAGAGTRLTELLGQIEPPEI